MRRKYNSPEERAAAVWAYKRHPETKARERERQHRPEAKARVRVRKEDPEYRVRVLVNQAKFRAKLHDLPFDPDISDLLPPPTTCPALGLPLDYSMGKGRLQLGPSIDRIVPSLGYVKGNRIIVSDLANRIKQEATAAQIAAVANFYSQLVVGAPAN